MKQQKPDFEKLSGVLCTGQKCYKAHGKTYGYQHPIKVKVVQQMKSTVHVKCYACQQFEKTGKTKKELKWMKAKAAAENDD